MNAIWHAMNAIQHAMRAIDRAIDASAFARFYSESPFPGAKRRFSHLFFSRSCTGSMPVIGLGGFATAGCGTPLLRCLTRHDRGLKSNRRSKAQLTDHIPDRLGAIPQPRLL